MYDAFLFFWPLLWKNNHSSDRRQYTATTTITDTDTTAAVTAPATATVAVTAGATDMWCTGERQGDEEEEEETRGIVLE